MSDSMNLVKQWAEIINGYAEQALDELTGCGYEFGFNAANYVASIRGCCDAIIAATSKREGKCCDSCKFGDIEDGKFPCTDCINGAEGRIVNRWEAKE